MSNKSNNDTKSHVYEFSITSLLGPEYIPFVEDAFRILIIQVIYQVMLVMRNPVEYSVMDMDFLEACLYLVIGVCVYWLVFKRLVVFK